MNKNELSGSEALFGFCGWLTTREEKTVMSSGNDCTTIVLLIDEFCKANNLTEARDDWADNLTHPKEK